MMREKVAVFYLNNNQEHLCCCCYLTTERRRVEVAAGISVRSMLDVAEVFTFHITVATEL